MVRPLSAEARAGGPLPSGFLRTRRDQRVTVDDVTFVVRNVETIVRPDGKQLLEPEAARKMRIAVAEWIAAHGKQTPVGFQFMRKAARLSIGDAAGFLGLSPQALSAMEDGSFPLGGETWNRMATLLFGHSNHQPPSRRPMPHERVVTVSVDAAPRF